MTIIPPGIIIHVTYDAMGLDAVSNLPDMPCRVAIVTGEPSAVSGFTPIHVMPAYTAAFNALLDAGKARTWHHLGDCPHVMDYAIGVLTHDR